MCCGEGNEGLQKEGESVEVRGFGGGGAEGFFLKQRASVTSMMV